MSHTPASNESAYTPPASTQEHTLLGHPKGLFLLFMVEMWERFSYYGMRAILILYLVSVMAAKQMAPGVYHNTLQFSEDPPTPATAAANAPPPAPATHQESLYVAVDRTGVKTEAAAPDHGPMGLVITRAKEVDNPNEPGKKMWVADPAAAAGPVVVSGSAGKDFEDGRFGYVVTNPTDHTISCTVRILRDPADPRTYFTVNDNVESMSAQIKPDAERGPDDPPFAAVIEVNNHDSGRNWLESDAATLYGWYGGLAYLFPILGGLLADKLIGTHRSMLIGAILIAVGHIVLGLSGIGALAFNAMGMSTFMAGLAFIVLGTGHFKPTVSVMVGQLYAQGDPRRDGAFTIFYMGINLGAFLCAFVCGTLGEMVGWHYGFASAAGGMLLGLLLYLWGRPRYLAGVGEAPRPGATGKAAMLMCISAGLAVLFGVLYHIGLTAQLGKMVGVLQANPALGWSVVGVLLALIVGWVTWFTIQNRPEDRGPVITIFIFMLFNAVFWIGFEQAGSSLNLFTEQNTDRTLGNVIVPASWFQSVNAGLIFIMAPMFAVIWTTLGKRRMNPSQPMKIFFGLLFLGVGYIFMVIAARHVNITAEKASMLYIVALYFWHTVGELCLSPTGLSYVTKAAPVRFVSLLMGIWFISSFIALLGGGLIAAQVKKIETGEIKMWWDIGGQADFFFLFVVGAFAAALLMLILLPGMKKLMRNPED